VSTQRGDENWRGGTDEARISGLRNNCGHPFSSNGNKPPENLKLTCSIDVNENPKGGGAGSGAKGRAKGGTAHRQRWTQGPGTWAGRRASAYRVATEADSDKPQGARTVRMAPDLKM